MISDVSALSALAQKIMKSVAEKTTEKDEFKAINKAQFDGTTLEIFFEVLAELKASGLMSFYQDYEYKPYTQFGDMTTKQYNKLDIFLKITKQAV